MFRPALSGSLFLSGIILGILTFYSCAADDDSSVCCEKIGCYSKKEPWVTSSRQLPDPQCPPDVTIQFSLYTRDNSTKNHTITIWPEFNIDFSIFYVNKTTMVFIPDVGYSIEDALTQQLKDAFLDRVDSNVILVDWIQNGTYPQAVSNGRVIAGKISSFIKYVTYTHSANPQNFYIIGHGVSAHTAGLVGKLVPEIGRITGLDPAGPLFDKQSREVQLDTSDAKFVDILHTNCHPVTGIGTCFSLGHVDFFFNGGLAQYGCPIIQYGDKINEMVNGDYTTFYDQPDPDDFRCSHDRALHYFTTALSNLNCTYWGLTRTVFRFILDVFTSGFFAPFVTRLRRCSLQTCSPVGLNTNKYIARGSFDVATRDYYPYCIKQSSVTQSLEKKLRQYELDTGNDWDDESTSSTTPSDILFMNATES